MASIDIIDLTVETPPRQISPAEIITISDSEDTARHTEKVVLTPSRPDTSTHKTRSKPTTPKSIRETAPLSNDVLKEETVMQPPKKRDRSTQRKDEADYQKSLRRERKRQKKADIHSQAREAEELFNEYKVKLTTHTTTTSSVRASSPNSLFFIDTTADKLAEPLAGSLIIASVKRDDGLLLPDHVTVHTSVVTDATLAAAVNIPIPDSPVSTASDFIEYLDDLGAPRYFNTEGHTRKVAPQLCRTCGEQGHIAKYCTVLLCLTCGVKGEHSTRGCPVSIVCFSCGRKGHLARSCPTPRERNGARSDCFRCDSALHNSTNCPTLWRTYSYLSDTARQEALTTRETLKNLGFASDDGRNKGGGEGYIARDTWCYNCGSQGHLGDDCRDRPSLPDKPREPSAFGKYNTYSGPFASSANDATDEHRESERVLGEDFDIKDYYSSRGWENDPRYEFGGDHAGKRGKEKRKDRARAQERDNVRAAGDDEDDWFNRRGEQTGNDKRPRYNQPSNTHSVGRRDSRSYPSSHSYPQREPRRIEVKRSTQTTYASRDWDDAPAGGFSIKGAASRTSAAPSNDYKKSHRDWEAEDSRHRSRKARERDYSDDRWRNYGSGSGGRSSEGSRQQYRGGYGR